MAERDVTPAFATPTHGPTRARGLVLACIGLSLLLLLQVLLANRAVWAQHRHMRSVLTLACSVLRCEVPAWRELTAFRMLSHDVVAHPDAPDVLQVRGSFRNGAPFAQDWPALRVTLSDVDGKALYRGDFVASEYLAGGNVPASLGAGQMALIELDVRDPSQRAVSFDFAFIESAVTSARKTR